ncbi:MAG: MFS transporter [Pseudomonadota bacterium]
MKQLLREPDFRRIWLAGAMTGALRWLELLVVGVYVLDQTGSPSIVAAMTVARLAPMFLLGLPLGVLADRYERRSLLLLLFCTLMLASLALGVLAMTGRITLWQIAIGAFLNGILFTADFPLRRTMIGEVAGRDRLRLGMGLETATSTAVRALGPALGGLMLQTVGLASTYFLGAALYLASVVLLLRVRHRSIGRSGEAAGSISIMLSEGWRYVCAQRLILGVLVVTLVLNFWGFAYITMVPVIGEQILGLNAFPIGLLMSVEGLGGLLATLVAVRLFEPAAYTRIYYFSSLVFLLGVLGFGLSASFPLSLALNLVCGFSLAGFAVMQTTIIFLIAPPEMRSRMMGVLTVCIGAGPLGMLHLGWLADWLGAATAVQVIALEGLGALALTALIWPELCRATDLSSDRAK